jgi:iron complex transport system substrate-binding protein
MFYILRNSLLHIIIAVLFLGSACKNSGLAPNPSSEKGISLANTYAKGYTIESFQGYKILSVFNPWEHAQNITYKYVLAHKDAILPDSIKKYEVISLPVKKIVCLSTTHLAFLKELNEEGAICGVSAPEFIYDSTIRKQVERGSIANVGYDQAMNIETIIGLKPDFVMAYGVGSEASGQFQRLKQLGIKVVFNAEYLERTPLGKAEWIKFVGAFFDKEDTAAMLFNKTSDNYLALVKKAASTPEKPMILSGMPWKGVWYVPGGKSYASNFIYDAGGDYLWKEDGGTESLSLSLEAVMERANRADIWINPGSVFSKNEISVFDP